MRFSLPKWVTRLRVRLRRTIKPSSGRNLTGLLLHAPKAPRSTDRTTRRPTRLGHSGHERRVAQIALKLFDLLRARHGLGDDHRSLLETAALIHDAAKDASPADHDVRGAEMVLADRSLPLTVRRRRAVAMLVRYHRDATGAAEAAASIEGYEADALMTLLALLHAADGLDSRRVPVSAVIVRRQGGSLDVTCLTSAKLDKARRALTRRRKYKLLRRVLGVGLRVRVERALDEPAPR